MSDFADEGFIQEFLEESKEHLNSINSALLALEESITQNGKEERGLPQVQAVEQLFRSFHTIKGLSGMIGLQPAAQLSHSMESVLLRIQKTELEVTQPVIQALLNGVEKLSAVIATLSNPERGVPEVEPEVAAFAELISDPTPAPAVPPPVENTASVSIVSFLTDILKPFPEIRAGLNENDHPAILDAILKGRFLSLGIFVPSSERSQQGVNVAQIRQELSAAGNLIKAIPLVSGSSVRFAFLVASTSSIASEQYPHLEWEVLLPGRSVEGPASTLQARSTLAVRPEFLNRIAQTNLVRVDMNRLDDLIQMVGDLVVQRGALADLLNGLTNAAPSVRRELAQSMTQMDRLLRRLRDAVLRTRMVPLSEVFGQMPLVVRDLARATGKDVQLSLEGEETEIDKVLVDRLLDPLLHLVRNAVTHGLETPAERSAAGKSARGHLTLRGKPEGDHILVEVSDDGKGIDREKIALRASAMGLIAGNQEISDADILDLLCQPGFSTQEIVDLGAGRGVGMDVVKRMTTVMNGSLSLSTQKGLGTTFVLRLPLSLVILDSILVRTENEIYAVPQGLIDEVIEINPEEIIKTGSSELIHFRENALVVYYLARLFNLPPVQEVEPKRAYRYGLITNFGDHRTVIVVDQLIGLREVVVRPVTDPLILCPGVTGATELGSGRVVLILNPIDLLQDAKRKQV